VTEAPSNANPLRSARIPARTIIRRHGDTLRSARIIISGDGAGAQPTADPAARCTRKDGCTHVGT